MYIMKLCVVSKVIFLYYHVVFFAIYVLCILILSLPLELLKLFYIDTNSHGMEILLNDNYCLPHY